MLELLTKTADRAQELIANDDPQLALRAIHVVAQTATAYAKVYESAELAARIEALESIAYLN